MSKQRPSFQFYPQDFLSSLDVQVMTPEEVGCYCLLLFNCYVNGGKLPNNQDFLVRLCHGIAPAKNVMQKFYIDGDFLKQKRIDAEMRKQNRFSKQQSDNARKRWDKAKKHSMPSQCHGNAIASIRQCSSSSSSSSSSNNKNYIKKEEKMNKKDFEEFWNLYPKKVGKVIAKKKFLTLDKSLQDKIRNSLLEQKKSKQWQDNQFVPNPSTWINQERWLDEVQAADKILPYSI